MGHRAQRSGYALSTGLLAVTLTLGLSTPAKSCSCAARPYGFAAETGTFLPSNARGLLWFGGGSAPKKIGTGDFLVFQTFGSEAQRRTVVVSDGGNGWTVVGLREAMKPGNAFLFVARYSRKATAETDKLLQSLKGRRKADAKVVKSHPGSVAVFVAAFPLTLDPPPKLVVEDLKMEEIKVAAPASCSRAIRASTASLRLAPVRELKYFKDHLLYTTIVDGKEVRFSPSLCTSIPPGRSWADTGNDRLYSACARSGRRGGGLGPGAHEVRMRVVFPAAKDGPRAAPSSAERVEFLPCPN